MESLGKRLLRLLVQRDPASPEFRIEIQAALRPAQSNDEFGLWSDVFVEQELPWRRFLQSALLHVTAAALIWTISLSWIRQQKILDRAFDKSSLVTYTPEEYLPPLDTHPSPARRVQRADPAYAKQPILSVAREADNRSQTIVAPPDLKLNHDVALPNIVATGAVVPAVPLDATQAHMSRMVAPDQQVVAPAPDVQFAPKSVVQAAMKSDVIAPPPELAQSKSPVGLMNIGPSDVVAPAPQLSLPEQHMATRGKGHLPGGGVQPVGPPPSVAAGGGTATGGRLVALGIHPVAPTGPVAAPAGNRRGALSATPQGKPGASGAGRKSGSEAGAGADDGREMASLSSPGARPGSRAASVVSDDKITDVERKVFRGKRLYEMRLNMPNLNSTTGSWVMKFAELDSGKKEGDLLTPVLTEKSDPGYPLELIRANVHGMVTLYAVINATGKVTDIRVLDSPDDRLDSYAAQALARWKFMPAVKDGKPVALEAVVEIPFKVQRSF